jgi:murein DD-endopeptidase MepM/ murein hydrolase activator NlpD
MDLARKIIPALAFLLILVSPTISSAQSERITPLMLDVRDAPVPFLGSDGRIHLVYELWLKNFTSGNVNVKQVEILSGGGAVLETLDAREIATRLQLAGRRDSTAIMPPSTIALLFIHITMPAGQPAPHELTHRVQVRAEAAPPGQQEITETGGRIIVDAQPVAVIAPPLRGTGYISADSCCDAARHTRAALPVNGRVSIAQRYAVDWEQLDAQGRIYHGSQADVASYTIYGREALAVADAKVVSVIDGFPNQTPGQYPTNISIQQADGNSVVLDLGAQRYALYAHLQPGSIRVHAGDAVKRGQVIGLVGNSGNSVAPHLHFHVMSTASPLASNGLPYEIDRYQITALSPGTKAFDEAEEKGTPLAITPVSPPHQVTNGLPLDQLIISFTP